jgi:GT2 family glycosyltransferase
MSLLERVRNGLALTRDGHVSSLLAIARKALLTGDAPVAWLAADRLSRITGPAEAVPLLLRSAASALLGDAAGADADLRAAFHRNPEQPDVLAAALGHDDPALRQAAARRALGHADLRERAVREFAQGGAATVVIVAAHPEGIAIDAFWQGEAPLELAWRSETRAGTLALRPRGAASGGYSQRARAVIPWPGDDIGFALAAPDARAIIAPPVLNRAFAPPDNRRGAGTGPPGLLIIVPVYRDAEATRWCLDWLQAAIRHGDGRRIVVVEDASPSPEIVALTETFARDGRIQLLRQPINLGFAAAVNRALALREAGEDALIVNADAYVPAAAIDTLRTAAHAAPDIGTAVPFSNNGEDVSIPRRFRVNPLPSGEEIVQIDRIARAVNGGEVIKIPNGIGFCLYVRAEVLDAIGGFSGAYERGYFEDVDFCLRARKAGFRNVCATGAYVGHSGALSFGGDKGALVRRNLARIHAAFPGYRAESDAFFAADPLAAAARRIAEAWGAEGGAAEWRAGAPPMTPQAAGPAAPHPVATGASPSTGFTGLEDAAALRPGGFGPAEREGIARVARLRAAEGRALIVLGGGEADLALLESPSLWLTGPIDDSEIPDWLARWSIREIVRNPGAT